MPVILCIEDDPILRKQIVEELRFSDYETLEATNGREGLAAVIAHKPDLVLSDVMMPEMDGYAFVETLRNEHPELADIPVVLLTALADREQVIKGKRLGVEDYVTKPVDYELLLATIEARLAQVTRMTVRKQMQMFALYRSMECDETRLDDDEVDNLEAVADTEPRTAVMVAANPDALSGCQTAFENLGFVVVHIDSGIRFLRHVIELSPALVVIAEDTGDMPADAVARMMRTSCPRRLPVLLAMGAGTRGVETGGGLDQAVFDGVLSSCEVSAVAEEFARSIANLVGSA
ncbi:MAG: response regulator [Alphaproteobacteria bacterium]